MNPNPDPKAPSPPEPGSAESLGLAKRDSPERHDGDAEHIEDEGEPFDGNFV